MEADNETVDDEDAGDEVENEDLQMLDRFHLGNANEDDVPPSDSDEYLDMVDNDDETYNSANPMMQIISNTCNIMLYYNPVILFLICLGFRV
jgi:hypothetical protein